MQSTDFFLWSIFGGRYGTLCIWSLFPSSTPNLICQKESFWVEGADPLNKSFWVNHFFLQVNTMAIKIGVFEVVS